MRVAFQRVSCFGAGVLYARLSSFKGTVLLRIISVLCCGSHVTLCTLLAKSVLSTVELTNSDFVTEGVLMSVSFLSLLRNVGRCLHEEFT